MYSHELEPEFSSININHVGELARGIIAGRSPMESPIAPLQIYLRQVEITLIERDTGRALGVIRRTSANQAEIYLSNSNRLPNEEKVVWVIHMLGHIVLGHLDVPTDVPTMWVEDPERPFLNKKIPEVLEKEEAAEDFRRRLLSDPNEPSPT